MSLTDHTKEMAELYAQGYSMQEIAEKFGTSRQRVQQLIRGTYSEPHGGRLRWERHVNSVLAAHRRILENVSSVDEEAAARGIKGESLRALFRRHHLRLPPQTPPAQLHGTYYRYQEGCRCPECQEARKAHQKRLRERGPKVHGTASAYFNYACRCDECRAAGSIANRLNRKKRNQRRRLTLPRD